VPRNEPIPEIAFTGDLTERESDLTQQLLDVPPGGNCLMYFDSPGGNPYVGLSLMSLMLLRDLRATGIVTGECSSAALWPLAACRRRYVTRYSVLLFHPMKWQSEENVGLAEAAEWARHFGDLEKTMDELLAELFGVSRADMAGWMQPGRYLTGGEIAESGLAELIGLEPLNFAELDGAVRRRKQRNS
jgi:ATP-dependent Clp protease protease subunit